MLPREILATTTTPSGEPMSLVKEGVTFVVRVGSAVLMSSRVHGSEEAMADVTRDAIGGARRARVLIGGLGLGYTLRACLDRLAPDAELVVRELVPAIVQWNREIVGDLAQRPLEDERVRVEVGDVFEALAPHSFDAILLDVDNGPEALTVESNARLYRSRGVERCAAALRPGGVLIVWSAFESPRFERELSRAGLVSEVVRVRARGPIKKGSRHLLYVGRASRR